MATLHALQRKFAQIWPHLDERARRLLAATEARALGYGGVAEVSRACGLSRLTIAKGIQELANAPLPPGRVRRPGAGRPTLLSQDPTLLARLEALVEPLARGDPMSPLRWTCKSTRTLAATLTARRHPVSHVKVAQLLQDLGYSLQGNRKTEEGAAHPDRDAQFRHINAEVQRALAAGLPVLSVDTKKKELVGNFANAGRRWRPGKTPEPVQGHDFPAPAIPRAYPYGLYDLGRNTGFVNVGTDHDTGAFAVASLRGWWRHEGRRLYPRTRDLLLTADGGGSNGSRLRLWKLELQAFADDTGLTVTVCHFPPGTSKWNKVEHRLFSFISSNWRGEPLRDYETVVRLIAGTTTAQGLRVTCRLDRRKYAVGRKVSDAEFAQVQLRLDAFHGEWNYTILPRHATKSRRC
jgi:Rhodopirellula transposase DDE domain